MHTSLSLAMAAATASLLLALGSGLASARSLSVSAQQIRATWRSLEFGVETTIIRCPVTLEGSFHAATLAKVARALIGAITHATVQQAACSGGTVAAFNGTESYNGSTTTNTLPWHLTYESFTGTLPAISSVRLLLGRFRFGTRDAAGICTGQYGTAEDNILLSLPREAGGRITAIEPVAGSNGLTLFRMDGGISCRTSLRMSGSGEVTQLNSTTPITITLI